MAAPTILAYKKNQKEKFIKGILCNFLVRTENMKKLPSKVAHNRPPIFFSVLPTGPKQALISISVP